MLSRIRVPHRLTVCLLLALVAAPLSLALAGHRFFQNNSVGGISIDPAGVVRAPSEEGRKMLLNELRKDIQRVEGPLNVPVPLRKVSLRGLEEAIRHAMENNFGQLPDEVRFLAGLQRIQYVFVYPEQNDIVLAGPAEGWRVDENANVVGITSGRPVLRLDDLLVALRTVRDARQVGISCSIDPTAEGMQRLQTVLAEQRERRNLNPQLLEPLMKEAFGPQQVKLTGVPEDSHFARVLVAADYRMKRLAMNLDAAPIPQFPSYVDLVKNQTINSRSNPRWWLACNYQPLARSEDGLAWEIRGPGVKCLTEEDFVAADGNLKRSGRTSEAAQRWADMMTDRYAELSQRDAVFGELRNLMDMCVVAALVEMHDLRGQANCELPTLYNPSSSLTVAKWNAPKTVDPQCSFLRTKKGWVVTASGGVQVESWQVASQEPEIQPLRPLRQEAGEQREQRQWWWN